MLHTSLEQFGFCLRHSSFELKKHGNILTVCLIETDTEKTVKHSGCYLVESNTNHKDNFISQKGYYNLTKLISF